MILRLRLSTLVAPILLSLATLAGCSAGADAPADGADSELASKAPKLGTSNVQLPPNRSASSIAVLDTKIYVGLYDTQLAIVDATTMKVSDVLKTYDLGGETSIAVRASEGVIRDGKSIVMLGYDNTGPKNAQFSFVLSWLDSGTKKITKDVRIVLDKNILSNDEDLVQRPQGAVAIKDGKVYLAIQQLNGIRKIASFAVPSAERTVLNQDGALLAHGMDLVPAGKGLAFGPDGKSVYMGVPHNSNDGFVDRLDLATGKHTTIGEKLGHPLGVAFADGKLYVDDYNGALLTLDASTGKVLHREELDDNLRAMAFDDKYVYLVTDGSKFVVKRIDE